MIKKYNIDFVAISEPFAEDRMMPSLASFSNFLNFCSSESMGGKICLLWREPLSFVGVISSNQMFSSWVGLEHKKVLVSFVYAKCTQVERRVLWKDLEDINPGNFPWLVIGDFNIIKEDGERVKGHSRLIVAMEEFKNSLDNCGRMEVSFNGRCVS